MNHLAWQLSRKGTSYDLEQVSKSLPDSPPAGYVRIRVHAVSLNYRDIITWRNMFGKDMAGRIPTSDGAGEVIEVGEGVTEWRKGARVAGCFFQKWESGPFKLEYHNDDLGGNLDGMLQQVIDLPSDGIVAIPEGLSYEHASTLPCAGLTAYYSLFERGHFRPNQTVLCIGTGGVSIFALQFAKAIGARAIVISRSPDKLERARQLGAWETICTTDFPNWSDQVWELTDRQGVDHVVEVGGPGTLEQSMKAVTAGGHIALIGVLTGFGPPTSSLFPLLVRNVTLNGIYVGPRATFQAMNHFISDNNILPAIDRFVAFDQAPEAFAALEAGKHFGKIVIRVT